MQSDSELRVESLLGDTKINDFIKPRYDGRSVCNIPETIAKIFGCKYDQPLIDPEIYEISEGIQNIVLVLLDGFGYDNVKTASSKFALDAFNKIEQGSSVFPITSVFPSTTSTATTSIHTGLTPQQHGVVGFSMYFREFGTIADTLRFTPFSGGRRSLFDLGLDSQTFVGDKTIHQRLSEEGIFSNLYVNKWIVNSGLSRFTSKGAHSVPHITAADMFTKVRKNLEKSKKNSFHFAYYASPDTIAHARGPFSEEYAAEVESLFYTLNVELLSRLDQNIARKTLMIISSDHGLSQVSENDIIDAADHPDFLKMLKVPPCGDSRCLILHVQKGMNDNVTDYFERNFEGQFELIPSKDALTQGFLGFGKIKEGLEERIGDVIAIPKKMIAMDNSLLDSRSEPVPGRHGGLSRNEMIVPLMIRKLVS